MTQEPDLLKMLVVAENAGEAWADGEHIDIFTPTRVRLLIERVVRAEQAVARVREFSAQLSGYCSPYGVAHDYAKQLDRALDGDTRG